MAGMGTLFVSQLILIVALSICVHKKVFVQPDGVSITVLEEDVGQVNETFTFSAIWSFKQGNGLWYRPSRRSMYVLLMLLCGDVETCPGPSQECFDEFMKSRGMKILHQNICGLFGKFHNLQELFDRCTNIDIMTLSETHIIDGEYDDNEGLFQVPSYTFLKRNRQAGKGGGLAMFIRDGIKWERRHDLENDDVEGMWVEVFVKNAKSFLIGVYYRPPNGSNYLPANFNDVFSGTLQESVSEGKEIIILGDFNVNYLKQDEHKDFKALVRLYGFSQVIKQATRISKNTSTLIDLILSNNRTVISRSGVFPISLSDHDMVGCIRKLHNNKYAPRIINCRDYSSYEPQLMKEDFKTVDWSSVYNANDVSIALKYFNDIVKGIFDRHAPHIVKKVRGKPCSWINSDIRKLMVRRDRILRKSRKTKKDEDWNLYKKLRNSCNNKMKYAKREYQKDLLNENMSNPRRFWNTIKDIFPTKTKTMKSGVCSDQNQPSIFSEYYANVVRYLKEKSISLIDFVWRRPCVMTSRTERVFEMKYICKGFVLNELKHLKRHKATGVDELPPGMLKDIREYIADPLCYVLNLSVETATVPSKWKIARLIPIHKSGSRKLPANFRPISVLPVLSKLLEKNIHRQYMDFLEEEKLLSDCQFGYRLRRSTNLAATLFVDNVRNDVDKGNLVGAVFIDLKKAFDTLSHDVLLTKLQAYGVQGKELAWFTDYLFGRQQYVQLGMNKSSNQPLFSGVPQGSIMGRLLFMVFYNDLTDLKTNSRVLKYADDTVVYCSGKDVESIEVMLSHDMDLIAKYLEENELIMNLEKGKTEVMLFGTAKRLSMQSRELDVRYKGEAVKTTTSYKYLGYALDPCLTLSKNFEDAYKRASNRLRLLAKLRDQVTSDVAYKIYQMMIVPILTYSGTIKLLFTRTQLEKLSSIERRAKEIIGPETDIPPLDRLMKMKSCLVVRKCLDNETCSNFCGYFQVNNHNKNTRNKAISVKLPKVKLEFNRQAFRFAGAKIYNELPNEIRGEKDFKIFRHLLVKHFS